MSRSIEERVRMLEDIEEIRQLKSKYVYSVDERDWDGVLNYFAEDAKVDFGFLGRFEGKKEIEKFYKETLPPMVSFCIHMTQDAVITVEGDRARGKWYMHESATFAGDRAAWGAMKYEDEFARRNGKWKCIHCLVHFMYLTTYEEGWVKKRMMFL